MTDTSPAQETFFSRLDEMKISKKLKNEAGRIARTEGVSAAEAFLSMSLERSPPKKTERSPPRKMTEGGRIPPLKINPEEDLPFGKRPTPKVIAPSPTKPAKWTRSYGTRKAKTLVG